MELLCAAIKRDSISPLRFSFFRQFQNFLCENSFVCRLKCPKNCFSSCFCFLVIFILLMFVLSVLFPVAVISFPPHFLMSSSSHCIDASTLSWMLVVAFPLFLSWHMQSIFIISDASSWLFFILSFIFLSSSLVYFKNGPEYLMRGTTQVFISFIRFSLVSCIFSFSRAILLKIFSFISACLMVSTSNIPKYL